MKKLLSFEFWQKFGKCLMVVIAVMPAAGLMVSIGNSLPLISDAEWLARVGNIIAQIGWGIIGNLHLLFALAIGGSWANERAGGAFAAGLAFILINLITGHFFGVKIEMLADPNAHVSTVFAGEIPVAHYFVNILGQPALNMGVFVGIIAGFVGATTSIVTTISVNYLKYSLSLMVNALFLSSSFIVLCWSRLSCRYSGL